MAYNKSDLVSKIAQKSNLTKAQAEAAVNAFQDVFVEAMRSDEASSSVIAAPVKVSENWASLASTDPMRASSAIAELSASSAPLAPAATRALASRLTFRLPTAFVSPLAPC